VCRAAEAPLGQDGGAVEGTRGVVDRATDLGAVRTDKRFDPETDVETDWTAR